MDKYPDTITINEKIINLVNKVKPDMIVFTGDICTRPDVQNSK